jgi:cyclase
MTSVPYSKGLHQLTGRCHAWLVPDGSWGWSNAGVIVGEGESLLVDTLFDLAMTREMLAAIAPVVGSRPIRTVVNTHANGDHWSATSWSATRRSLLPLPRRWRWRPTSST